MRTEGQLSLIGFKHVNEKSETFVGGNTHDKV